MSYYMHVNFIEWLDDLTEIARRCADAGFDGIELRGHDRSGRQPLDAYLAASADAAAAAGLDVVYGCGSESASADEAKRHDSLRDLQAVIRHAGERGYSHMNVFASGMTDPEWPYHQFEKQGSAMFSDDHRQRTVAFFREAGQAAEACGIELCFETHNGYPHDLPAPTLELVNAIDHPRVGVNFDFGNIYLHPDGGTLENAVATLAPHLKYVHLKNMMSLSAFTGGSTYRGTPLRDGDINHEKLVRELITAGYDGPWAIENVMPGDKHHLMQDDLAYLRSVIDRVKKSRPA